MQRWCFVYYFTFTFISSLPCLHTFWHAIHNLTYIFNVSVFLNIEDCVGRWFVQLSSYILVTQVKGPGLNSLQLPFFFHLFHYGYTYSSCIATKTIKLVLN